MVVVLRSFALARIHEASKSARHPQSAIVSWRHEWHCAAGGLPAESTFSRLSTGAMFYGSPSLALTTRASRLAVLLWTGRRRTCASRNHSSSQCPVPSKAPRYAVTCEPYPLCTKRPPCMPLPSPSSSVTSPFKTLNPPYTPAPSHSAA